MHLYLCLLARRFSRFIVLALLCVLGLSAFQALAAERHLTATVPPAVHKLQATGRLPAERQMQLALALPLRDLAGLTNFLNELYDPASPLYQHYLSVEEFTERFGPTEADYQAVLDFAHTNGFELKTTYPNRLLVDVSGPVSAVEQAFHIALRVYPHPSEPRTFFAPDAAPALDARIPLLDVGGLDDFAPPRPMDLRRKPMDDTNIVSFATGSGPGGDFIGSDFRAAYAPGVNLTGVGQVIGLFEFGMYFTNDIILYKKAAGLPDVPVTNVLLDGLSGIPAPGTDDGEETLDIDMAMSMAPGASILVYEGNSAYDILNRIATDNKAKQIGCSFGFLPAPSGMDNIFLQYAAQGQTFFVASGDGGAYSTNAIFAPGDDPNITCVGGTSLTTNGKRGPWASETTWVGSGGGHSPNYGLPSYQSGMSWTANHGSASQRNFPDVSMLADTVIYWFLKNGQSGTVGGTSAAAPLWAGFMALLNQQAVANGRATLGNLNTTMYNIGRGSNDYTTVFHDITTGNNFNTASPANFSATAGFDLCTGWGTPNGSNTINKLAATTDTLQISPGTGFTTTTPYGVPFSDISLDLTLTNAGAATVNWSIGNTSVWLNVSALAGTLPAASDSTNVSVSLNTAAATNLSAGTYYAYVWLTNQTTGIKQNRLFTLQVSPANFPLTLSGFNAKVIVPPDATTASPQATAFDIPNGYCFYSAGLNTNSQVSGSGGLQGLPANGTVVSQADGQTTFQLGPYGGLNALLVGNTYAASGTLTLLSPASYNSLAILASSANGGGNGSLILHFTNGTSSASLPFNAQDWFGTSSNVAIQGFGRLQLTAGLSTQDNGSSNPNLYQTIVNLAALGLNQPVSSVTFTRPSGQGTSQDSGVFAISGALMPPQVIITGQPQSTTNTNPSVASTLSVFAMGAPPLSYQWFSGTPASNTLLTNQNSASLVFNPVSPSQAGNYFVVVTNSYNAVTSSVAALTVYTAPLISQQPNPTNLSLFTGETAKMSVTVLGAVPLAYSWTKAGVPIAGATTSSYTLAGLQTGNSGVYTAVITNAFGAVTSSPVTLTVNAQPAYPVGQLVLADHPIGYWRLNESSGPVAHDYISGLNGTFTNVLLNQAGNKLLDTHTAARFGSLASANSYVANIPVDFATTGNAAFSIEAWVNGAAQGNDNGVITKGTGGGGEQFNLDCGSGNHAFRFFVRDAGGGAHLANGTVAPNGVWHHVVGVCDEANGKVSLYVDGALNASGTITAGSGLLSTANAMTIGSRQSGSTTAYDLQFLGSMEEVAVYNYALTAARVQAHYAAATNRPPLFTLNPFTLPDAAAGQAYSGTIATNAADPNGDILTFSKVSGPSWLGVAGNGSLSGTPLTPDAGPGTFVVSARDTGGLSSTATLNLAVTPPSPFTLQAFLQDTSIVLNWSGGVGPYQLQMSTNLSPPLWLNIGSPTTGLTATNDTAIPSAFYRVLGR